MKIKHIIFLLVMLSCERNVIAQERPSTPSTSSGQYATDIATVGESQQEALEQARQMLEAAENPTARAALQTAIKEMETADKALQAAKKNPDHLPSAVAAEQAAYQALLKLVPHEFRVNRSKRGKSGGAGQPGQQQMEQLEMTSDENRYETERQAAAPPSGAQREQLEAADRLKQLSQRQQDLNDRLRELQTALQQARTEKEQEEIKRELKHLADEERQMLSDVDELRQKLDQASNASSLSQTAHDLDQTRAETQRAAEQLANQSVSQALASGTRAQQSMQNIRENLRGQTSSQFSSQMRQLQNQARDLAKQEEDIGRGMASMDSPDHKTLDNEAQRQQLGQKMAAQQSALTNLLANMQDVTEKAESTEPLLSEQLYDTLRRAGQMHTDNLLDTSGQLLDRGFVDKAAQVENAARTNINELRQRVEHATESVLGSQSQALRYAQSELDDLTREVQQGVGGTNTNSSLRPGSSRGQGTNSPSSREQANGKGEQGEQNGGQPGRNGEQGNQNGGQATGNGEQGKGSGDVSKLRELVQQSGGGGAHGGTGTAGPIVGGDFANWANRMRDVEQVVDSTELRNRLATVRERVAAYRAEYRQHERMPAPLVLKEQVVQPMIDIRAQIQEDLARLENARSLVPLDHDPVPDNYSELVRKYYEKLGGGQ